MQKEKVKCPNCGKLLIPYILSTNLCQLCYRKILNKYCFYEIKDGNGLPKENTKARQVINLSIYEKLNTNEIAKKINASKTYVRSVKNKYLIKCDTNGFPKPLFLKEKEEV